MPPRLKHIEVENFKSFKDRTIIGPLKPFNAVIGPNGSGKSNFMDAISFVMGEKTQSLRVKRLSDLIHGAAINKPISRSASVTAVFFLDDEENKEVSFQRSVQGSSSEYKINGNIVSSQEYLAELEKLCINVKAKNFLVFQGAVESVAMKNPKEITALFEEISGSGALKDEYEKLKRQIHKAQEDMNQALQKKRGMNAEKIEARIEIEEAEKYSKLKDDLNDKLVEHQLFRLFHNEREMKNLENERASKVREVEKIEKKKVRSEDVLKEKKKEQGKLGRELAKVEQDIREAEVEISKKKPQFIKVKQRVTHTQKKLDTAIKTLEQARKADEAHNNDIRKLEEELAGVESAKDEYESVIAGESQSQGRDVHLEDEQVKEYHRLKEEAAKRSAPYMLDLDSVNREQKADQDRLDNLARMRSEAENKHRQKEHEKEEMQKRVEKLQEHIRTSEQALQDQRQLREDFQRDVGSSKNRVQQVQKQLEDVNEQLGDARTDKHEDARRKKKQEILEKFKSIYPGVYDRMINMCHPSHKKYSVAITKVLGKYLEAIVVDTEKTARNCITYLKEQRLEPETFLPIDYLKLRALKERLRNITEPKGVKLLYDVLQFEPQAIANAVLFATNNALVCETPEDAMKVAYDIGGRYDAVALDGTFYQKSGIISGGSLDLARKAERWDEKHMSQLMAQKEKLTEELREAMKKSQKESELNTVDSQIKGTETRLKYAKTDVESTTKQIKIVDSELSKLTQQITKYGPKIEEIEKSMQEREMNIGEVKMQMNRVEDVVFSAFCQEIGVRNIRQYEDRELRTQEERKQKRLEFQKQINRISSMLQFERTRDMQSNVSRWERSVNDEEEKLETCRKQEAKHRDEIDKDLRQVEELKSERLHKKQECDTIEEEVGKARREVGTIAKDVQEIQKQVVSLENKIDRKKSDRHAILMECKMQDIAIPMTHGNMEDIGQGSDQSQSESNTSTQQFERESRIVIDYEMLSDHYKYMEERDEIKKAADNLSSAIKSLQDTLNKIQAPNLRATEKWDKVQESLQSTNAEFESLRKDNKKATSAFELIKQQRYERFTKCFDHVASEIDTIYKSLAQNNSAQAFLAAKNPEEPYLDGIDYNCVAPGKRFQPMKNLSGGEKTVAALALLFAIHSYQPSPFFVLDEVDAALDNINIGKVAKYITQKKESLQTIVISLKEEFYSHADVLIGIWPSPADVECLVSQAVRFDLTEFPL